MADGRKGCDPSWPKALGQQLESRDGEMQPGCLGRGTWWLRGSELGTLPRDGSPSLSPGPKARGAGENDTRGSVL